MPDTHPSGDQLFPVRADFASKAYVDQAGYRARYERAARDPDGYWAEEAKRIAWMKPPTKIKNTSFNGDVSIKWFEDGTLNASVSCLDRHLADARRPDRDHLGKRRSRTSASTSPIGNCTRKSAASPAPCAAWA